MSSALKTNDAVVLLSGGQDSATCLFWAKKKFERVSAVTVFYGQKHDSEIAAADRIAKVAGVNRIELRVSIPGISGLTEGGDVNHPHPQYPQLPGSFLPGRNAVLLSLAVSQAVALGAATVVAGMCQTDYSGYPDCREDFIRSMVSAFRVGVDSTITIVTPLMNLDKAQTWALAADLGIVDLVARLTRTCYQNDRSVNPWGHGCSRCAACKLRSEGFFEARRKGWLGGFRGLD